MKMTPRRSLRLLFVALVAGVSAGCASGMLAGPRDVWFERPPFYSAVRGLPGEAPIAHVRVAYQRGATQPVTFDPTDRSDGPAAQLIIDMNAYLDSLGMSTAFVPASQPVGHAPDISFGCEVLPDDDCGNADDRRRFRLAAGNASSSWLEWWRRETAHAGVERILVITLEVGNYLPHQRNLLGAKELRLGTGYTIDVPWLTALDRPVSVLQITGALLDGEGRVLRMGAEGLLARRTNLLVGALGAQRIIVDEDVAQVRTLRREDLPGAPLVWQAALRSMVAQLTGLSRIPAQVPRPAGLLPPP
jgi:hypothetical protein